MEEKRSARKKGKKKSKAIYFSIPISKREFSLFTSTLPVEKLKLLMNRIVNTFRLEDTDYFIFAIFEKDVLYFFIVSVHANENKVYVVSSGDDFVNKFVKNATDKGFLYPEQEAKILLEMGIRNELEHVRSYISRAQSSQHKEPDEASFYAKEIQEYINDMTKGFKKQHAHLADIIEKKRRQLIDRYVKNSSLPLTNVSRKNRPIIENERLRVERQKQQAQRKKQQAQLQIMKQQDRPPLQLRRVLQSVQETYGNRPYDPDDLADDVLWKQLGLHDPVSLQVIRNPVILPSFALIDQKSLLPIKQKRIDPTTNLQMPADTNLQVDKGLKKLINTIATKSDMITDDATTSALDKARKLYYLRQEYAPLLDKQKKKNKIIQS